MKDDLEVAHAHSSSSIIPRRHWNLQMLVFEERLGKRSTWRKGENEQQTQPRSGVDTGFRT